MFKTNVGTPRQQWNNAITLCNNVEKFDMRNIFLFIFIKYLLLKQNNLNKNEKINSGVYHHLINLIFYSNKNNLTKDMYVFSYRKLMTEDDGMINCMLSK